jgi:hypothetical protein
MEAFWRLKSGSYSESAEPYYIIPPTFYYLLTSGSPCDCSLGTNSSLALRRCMSGCCLTGKRDGLRETRTRWAEMMSALAKSRPTLIAHGQALRPTLFPPRLSIGPAPQNTRPQTVLPVLSGELQPVQRSAPRIRDLDAAPTCRTG